MMKSPVRPCPVFEIFGRGAVSRRVRERQTAARRPASEAVPVCGAAE